ncbi:MAG: hypothetical protein II924_00785 [Kiritimatiellae bacterium]|nr:hypothetical protein [Kiritimatiellia bacterium]
MKRAFTLMEINLAILIMAGGILSVVGLYSLGFRENRQSIEDVATAAYADAVMSPLVMALSSTNVTWSSFRALKSRPSEYGWTDYFNNYGMVEANVEGKARTVYNETIGALQGLKPSDTTATRWNWSAAQFGDTHAGLVVLHKQDSPVVRIGFRAAKVESMLLSAPLYYTEVRFQGVVNQ